MAFWHDEKINHTHAKLEISVRGITDSLSVLSTLSQDQRASEFLSALEDYMLAREEKMMSEVEHKISEASSNTYDRVNKRGMWDPDY